MFCIAAAYSMHVASTFVSCKHLLLMGNRKHRPRRRGNGRPSPVGREREEDATQLKRQRTTERVHRHKTKLKEIAEKARTDHDVKQ
jgi:hypothetical protein